MWFEQNICNNQKHVVPLSIKKRITLPVQHPLAAFSLISFVLTSPAVKNSLPPENFKFSWGSGLLVADCTPIPSGHRKRGGARDNFHEKQSHVAFCDIVSHSQRAPWGLYGTIESKSESTHVCTVGIFFIRLRLLDCFSFSNFAFLYCNSIEAWTAKHVVLLSSVSLYAL